MKVNNLNADMMRKIQQATKHCNLKQTITIVERLQIEFRRQYEEDTEFKYDFVEVAKIIRAYKTFGTHVRIYKDLIANLDNGNYNPLNKILENKE